MKIPALAITLLGVSAAAALDLGDAVVVQAGDPTGAEKKAAAMLVEEVEKRARIRWPIAASRPSDAASAIVISNAAQGPAEGYELRTEPNGVTITGNDARGVLFGIGHLLRALRMEPGKVSAPDGIRLRTAPRYPLRGHQLGYRPKTNSYDGWTLAMWEQYIRDLAAFGTNAIELIPPRSDDDDLSPHFPLPKMETMIGMSRLIADYGLDVWIWYPALDKDYSDAATVEFALTEWAEVFRRLPRVDAVFVPGGDPGHTQPKHLMALLEKQTASLRRFHPKAQMWIAPQSFSQEWLEEFYAIVRKEPDWLAGIVFGPQTRVSLPQLRAAIPQKYAIRHYPDITHSLRCQYPAPDWDLAYALTEGREPINPRPLEQARIFQLMQPHTIGFITYSEGCNDDVNKFVWSGLGWNPEENVAEILRQYSRYFLGERYTSSFPQALLALERNWSGPLAANSGVETTLAQLRAMERAALPEELLNWRFQQALYRAYYDAYNRSRLIYETSLEEQAMAKLREAPAVGARRALDEAERILDRAVDQRVSPDLRARVFELAEALYQSIRMQLSVTRYKAIALGRGANLDAIDTPLSNRLWLKQRFDDTRRQSEEAAFLKGIRDILDWTNPGPGGFYDDLGDPARQPHLVRGPGFEADPAHLQSSLVGFPSWSEQIAAWRLSWLRHAEALNDQPLQMRYSHLDPNAHYRLRVVYAGESTAAQIRLVADETAEVHPFRAKDLPPRPVEFDIPRQATADGELTLTWHKTPGLGGNGRGLQVAEIWLMKK